MCCRCFVTSNGTVSAAARSPVSCRCRKAPTASFLSTKSPLELLSENPELQQATVPLRAERRFHPPVWIQRPQWRVLSSVIKFKCTSRCLKHTSAEKQGGGKSRPGCLSVCPGSSRGASDCSRAGKPSGARFLPEEEGGNRGGPASAPPDAPPLPLQRRSAAAAPEPEPVLKPAYSRTTTATHSTAQRPGHRLSDQPPPTRHGPKEESG
ncbi:hypothetical protein MHYP_G00137570 [Metynnis hypsauchen]